MSVSIHTVFSLNAYNNKVGVTVCLVADGSSHLEEIKPTDLCHIVKKQQRWCANLSA